MLALVRGRVFEPSQKSATSHKTCRLEDALRIVIGAR